MAIATAAFAAWTALSVWEEADAGAVKAACNAVAIEVNVILHCAPGDGSYVVYFLLFAAIPFVAGWSCARYLRARPFVYSSFIACIGAAVCLFAGAVWTLVEFAPARQHWEAGVRDRLGALPFVCIFAAAISLLGVFVGRRFNRGAKNA